MTDATPVLVTHNYQPSALSLRVSSKVLTVGVATADYSYQMLADPRQLQFLSRHTGIVTTWEWSWGDGTPNSFVRDPLHQFEVVGSSTEYDVRLTISGGAFEEKTIEVFQLSALPGASDLDVFTLTVGEANNMTVEQAANMTAA